MRNHGKVKYVQARLSSFKPQGGLVGAGRGKKFHILMKLFIWAYPEKLLKIGLPV